MLAPFECLTFTLRQFYNIFLWRNTFITWPREICLQVIDVNASNVYSCRYKVCTPLEFFLSKWIRPPLYQTLTSSSIINYPLIPNGNDNWHVCARFNWREIIGMFVQDTFSVLATELSPLSFPLIHILFILPRELNLAIFILTYCFPTPVNRTL